MSMVDLFEITWELWCATAEYTIQLRPLKWGQLFPSYQTRTIGMVNVIVVSKVIASAFTIIVKLVDVHLPLYSLDIVALPVRNFVG